MKGSKGAFTVHDQEQICQKNRVRIFSDLEFGTGSDFRVEDSTQKHSYSTEEFLCYSPH